METSAAPVARNRRRASLESKLYLRTRLPILTSRIGKLIHLTLGRLQRILPAQRVRCFAPVRRARKIVRFRIISALSAARALYSAPLRLCGMKQLETRVRLGTHA